MNSGHYASPKGKACEAAQKIAQNKPERKIRQSEIMAEFYANGGSEKVSIGVKRKQRSGIWWKHPLKRQIYDI